MNVVYVRGGKYLTFAVGGETYAFEILKVQEIIGIMKVTSMPYLPPQIRGVINLRGKIIPVLDLRKKFGFLDKDDTQRTCIVVINFVYRGQEKTLGTVVDEVQEVVEIREDLVEPPPDLVETSDSCVGGIARVEGKVVLLLDVTRLVDSERSGNFKEDK